MSDPKRIWLQQPEDSDPMYAPYEGDRTWSERPIEAEDTEYVRADLYEGLQAQLDAVRERYIELLTDVRDSSLTVFPDDVAYVVFGDDWETTGTLEALLKETGDE